MDSLNLSRGKVLVLLMAAVIVAGGFGLLAMGLMLVLFALNLRSEVAVDTEHKHGISEAAASRCGGIAIWLLPIALLSYDTFFNSARAERWPLDSSDWSLVLLPTALFLMGLYEDFTARFSATARLGLMLIACTWFLYEYQTLMPVHLDLRILDWLLATPWLAYTVLLVCMVGAINAFNTSDGANGLLGGSAVLIGCVFVMLMDEPYIWRVLVTCWTLFLLVNVVSGRVFLGDSGSYLLGAVFAVGFLWLYKTTAVSFALILVLVFYPVLDFLMAMARRVRHRRPLMEPDNFHFHNLLFNFYQYHIRDKTVANSVTGLTIAALWPGVAVLLLYLGVAAGSELWLWIFGASFVEFGIIRYALLSWTHRNTEFETRPGMELDDAAT